MTNNIVKKTVIFTDYNCNNQCVFCIDDEKRKLAGKSTEAVQAEMIAAKTRGSAYLELIGGEFTIRPDSVKLVKFASKLGFSDIAMATNGRMFSYSGFAENMIEAGLTGIIFSLHGHNQSLHDNLTRSQGSFDQLIKGLENFQKAGFKNIGTNTAIVKPNLKQLPEIGRFIYSLGIRNSEFIFVDPNYGGAKLRFKELVPKISEAAELIKKCLEIGRGRADHWHIRYVPLCFFADYLDQISELDEIKKFKTEHIAPDFQNFETEIGRRTIGRVKAEICRKCKLDKSCEGVWREYASHYGLNELRPVMNIYL